MCPKDRLFKGYIEIELQVNSVYITNLIVIDINRSQFYVKSYENSIVVVLYILNIWNIIHPIVMHGLSSRS